MELLFFFLSVAVAKNEQTNRLRLGFDWTSWHPLFCTVKLNLSEQARVLAVYSSIDAETQRDYRGHFATLQYRPYCKGNLMCTE
jgi:hypothetical protein